MLTLKSSIVTSLFLAPLSSFQGDPVPEKPCSFLSEKEGLKPAAGNKLIN